jgi:hypothetical protein
VVTRPLARRYFCRLTDLLRKGEDDETGGVGRFVDFGGPPTGSVFDTATGRTGYTMPFATVGGINPQTFQTMQ